MPRPVTTVNRWEKISSKSWATNTTVRFTKAADLDPSRVLRSILINIQGTVTLATSPATAVNADNVGVIIEQFRAFGNHQGRGSTDNFIQCRGADLKELANLRAGVVVFDNSSPLATADAAYTIDFNIIVDFPPSGLRIEEQVGYFLDVPNWPQLEFDLQFGDEKSLFNVGSAVVSWSNQTVNVLGRYAQEKNKFAGFGFGLKYLIMTENISSQLTTTGTQQNLFQFDTKGKLRSAFLKTGVKSTTTTAPNNSFSTLSDAILNNIRIVQVPSQKFREVARFTDLKAIAAQVYKYNAAKGYALMDFTSDGMGFESLSPGKITVGEAGAPNLWLQADVVGAANQGLVVVQESLYYAGNIVIPTS